MRLQLHYSASGLTISDERLSTLKSKLAVSYIALRRLSSTLRELPDFLVVGAQKCGTTSLAAYLGQHPDIRGSFYKEVHYFDDGLPSRRNSYERGENWYRAHFPLRATIAPRQRVFEATPMYLFHAAAAERIGELIPAAKILIILRNPVDRAISHYWHSFNRGHEDLPMLAAMQEEENRIGLALGEASFRGGDVRYFSYKARGRYAEQIRRYLDIFPSEHLKVISSDDLFADPGATISNVFDFVGVEPNVEIAKLAPRNVTANRQPTPDGVREYLGQYFAEPNRELCSLLDRDFGW